VAGVIVLAIETSTPQASVAFGNADGVLVSAEVSGIRPRREAVIPTIEELLERSGLELAQVGGIAAGIGPGLFTSLRVGLGSAKALAQVMRVPLVGLSSLDVLAYSVRHARRPIASVIDARRGEVFYSIYRPVPGGVTRVGENVVASPDSLAADLQAMGEEVLAVGNGAVLYREQLEATLGGALELAPYALRYPSAATMIELALPRFEREEHDELFDVVPLYLRKSDAEIAWDRREAAGQA
jgi:tRNA threonylcarbamoyladenosine biosynthesis protein TsaB